jgi:hypothetical protein
MRTRPLPNDPSLEHLRKEAKRLCNAVRDGDAAGSCFRTVWGVIAAARGSDGLIHLSVFRTCSPSDSASRVGGC